MKKTLYLFLAFWLVATPAFAVNTFEDEFRFQSNYAQKTDKTPNKMQIRIDYTGTISGSPIYVGYAARSVATDADRWRVYKYTDSAAGPTLKQTADCAWDDRGGACTFA